MDRTALPACSSPKLTCHARLIKNHAARGCSTEVSRRGVLDSGCIGPAILHTTRHENICGTMTPELCRTSACATGKINRSRPALGPAAGIAPWHLHSRFLPSFYLPLRKAPAPTSFFSMRALLRTAELAIDSTSGMTEPPGLPEPDVPGRASQSPFLVCRE
jgi:hypothetical protein